MKKRFVKICLRVLCVFLTLITVGAIAFHRIENTRYFEGAAQSYYLALVQAGFPTDYAIALTELHLLHPSWNFVPLAITDRNPVYTWDYVIKEETKTADNNLISAGESQKPYRHPFLMGIFDAGHFPASVAAVEYFMDPRNFLNEADIFQFYDLKASGGTGIEAVEAILKSTFMENSVLENGKTYAEYFVEVGSELNVSPVYLAVKARQEQGTKSGTPMLSGECGTLLNRYYRNGTQYSDGGNAILTPTAGHTSKELLSLNGLYNIFNIGASGNGLFNIYRNAMKYAQSGTSSMSGTWGGSAWNTVWKSIYGGAYAIKSSYIDRYQNTIYLQKFNVDSRSDRNFWGQYMQNVGGALTEGRTLYTSFASIGALDNAYTFLIPVYAQMPKEACYDPANGECSYLAAATDKYNYRIESDEPLSLIAENEPLYLTQQISQGGLLRITADVAHSYGIRQLEYQWDSTGEWTTCSYDTSLDLALPVHFSAGSSHILVIRGIAAYDHTDGARKSNYGFLCMIVYVNVLPPPSATRNS